MISCQERNKIINDFSIDGTKSTKHQRNGLLTVCCCRAANRRVRHGRGGERGAGGRRREEHRGVRPAGERGHPVALRAGRQQTVPEVPRGNRQTDRQSASVHLQPRTSSCFHKMWLGSLDSALCDIMKGSNLIVLCAKKIKVKDGHFQFHGPNAGALLYR